MSPSGCPLPSILFPIPYSPSIALPLLSLSFPIVPLPLVPSTVEPGQRGWFEPS